MPHYILLIHCPDQQGIIATVTRYIHQKGGNIVYIDQHVDREQQKFFMRLEAELKNDGITLTDLKLDFEQKIALPYIMAWQLFEAYHTSKMAIFVSKYDHCLYDILGRYRSGELRVEISFILSNHADLQQIDKSFDIPFYHIPVAKETKAKAEERQLALLKEYQVDFIVLARYMQIVSSGLIDKYPYKIINIHHSFLPAFPGAKPYHSAFKRGVKIIGATSHYVTEELDAGPIIEQDISRVSHTHSVKDFIAKGRDLEKIVLARAIKLHIARKTMVYDNKTVIFT